MEYFEYEIPYPADGDKSVPNVMTHSWREYGSRVGIWRILKILDHHPLQLLLMILRTCFYPIQYWTLLCPVHFHL